MRIKFAILPRAVLVLRKLALLAAVPAGAIPAKALVYDVNLTEGVHSTGHYNDRRNYRCFVRVQHYRFQLDDVWGVVFPSPVQLLGPAQPNSNAYVINPFNSDAYLSASAAALVFNFAPQSTIGESQFRADDANSVFDLVDHFGGGQVLFEQFGPLAQLWSIMVTHWGPFPQPRSLPLSRSTLPASACSVCLAGAGGARLRRPDRSGSVAPSPRAVSRDATALGVAQGESRCGGLSIRFLVLIRLSLTAVLALLGTP